LETACSSKSGQSWRESRWLILVEFALFGGIFVGRQHHVLKVAAIPYLLLLAWISLRVRRLQWKQIGFSRYRTWAGTFLLGVAGGVGLELFDLFGKQRILTRLLGKPPDLSDFAKVHGHLNSALLTIALVWIFAAYAEEFVYRGLSWIFDESHSRSRLPHTLGLDRKPVID
jgi:membrane protease YdiL (CAAX protease family)